MRERISVLPGKIATQSIGLVMIAIGLTQSLNYLRFSLVRLVPFSYATCKTLEIVTNGLALLAVLFSLYYFYLRRSLLKQQPGRSVAWTWISWFLSLFIVHFLLKLILGQVVFELQHGLFMLLNSLAVLATGALIHEKRLIRGGLSFLFLTVVAVFFKLNVQMVLEALGWILAFVVPGCAIYKRRE